MITSDAINDFEVQLKGETILVIRPDHTAYSINFRDLTEVYVETNDNGPWGYDVWFVLIDEIRDNGVTFPLGAIGEAPVIELLHKLKGFKLDGMNSTDNAKHICWSKFSKK